VSGIWESQSGAAWAVSTVGKVGSRASRLTSRRAQSAGWGPDVWVEGVWRKAVGTMMVESPTMLGGVKALVPLWLTLVLAVPMCCALSLCHRLHSLKIFALIEDWQETFVFSSFYVSLFCTDYNRKSGKACILIQNSCLVTSFNEVS
jgi:hypothetical protein